MKRIKRLIEAMKTLGQNPSESISEALASVLEDSHAAGDKSKASQDQRALVHRFMVAVITIAEDMEKPAKSADGEAAK